jgi:transglutaminase-like putative cysteine protease
MRRIRIHHSTRYTYAQAVTLLGHRLLVRPREGHDIRIETSLLEITPAARVRWQRDVNGNSVATVSFEGRASLLEVVSQVVVQHYEDQPLAFDLDAGARGFPFRYDPMEAAELVPYSLPVFPQDQGALGDWLEDLWRPGQALLTQDLLAGINGRIAERMGYRIREDPGVQTPAQTLTRGEGSCRDLATLFMECCRYCGLAARFVTGYLVSAAAVEDVQSTHAWSEVYLPGAGWRGFDSTSGQPTGGDHIAVAVNRRPDAVPPVAGSFLGPSEPRPVMEVAVMVEVV